MVEAGQLRRWSPAALVVANRGRMFLVLGLDEDRSINSRYTTWSYLMEGVQEWHRVDVIEQQSEVVNDQG
jgi:hypothetical protein